MPNPSFETFTSCPGATIGIQLSNGWSDANTGTADYYNDCFVSGPVNLDVPSNFMGIQSAKSGVSYSGIMTYENSSGPVNYREYVQAQLSSPLNNGIKY